MNCPYCGKEMQQGVVWGAETWRPGNGDWLIGKEKEFVRLWNWRDLRQSAQGHFCPDCRIRIMPVPEVEAPLDAVKNKLKGLMNRSSGEIKKKKADFTADKDEREKQKRKTKDPWEV